MKDADDTPTIISTNWTGKVTITPEGDLRRFSWAGIKEVVTALSHDELVSLVKLANYADEVYSLLVRLGYKDIEDFLMLYPPLTIILEDREMTFELIKNIQLRINTFLNVERLILKAKKNKKRAPVFRINQERLIDASRNSEIRDALEDYKLQIQLYFGES